MKFIINDQMVLLFAPEGPLVPYIASFSKWAMGRDTHVARRSSGFGSLRVSVGGSQMSRCDCAASHLDTPPSTFDIAHGGSGFMKVTPPRWDSSSIFCVIKARFQSRRYAGDD
jgi:hypothetical protein